MRRLLATVSGLAAGTALTLAAGCTFLVSFDDVPNGGADVVPLPGRDTGGPPFREDARPLDSGTTPQPDTCDNQFPLKDVKGCENFVENGQVCSDNRGITYPPGRDAATDVVTCTKINGARAICVKHCTGPGGCAHLPDGFPDQCDQCTTKANGTYCGSEMVGWVNDNYRLLVTCTNGRMSARAACATGCDAKNANGNAACN
jgi:hypothetical protein